MTKSLMSQALASPESFATTLVLIAFDAYGNEATEWAPETLLLELEDDFHTQLPAANFDRLMAGLTLVTTDLFYKSAPDFVTLCNVLTGDRYNPQLWDPATAAEIAWAITEALLLSPPDPDDEEPFTEEILAYIGHALDDEGIIRPPDVLRIAVRQFDPAERVTTDFSDDPLMFEAIYEVENEKTAAINDMVVDNLTRLKSQISQLKLIHGDTSTIFTK